MERLRLSVALVLLLGFAVAMLVLGLKSSGAPKSREVDHAIAQNALSAANVAASPASQPTSESTEQLRTISTGGPIYAIAFSPDGRLFATGGDDRSVRIWNTATGKQLHCLTGHDSAVTSVTFSPDGQRLASAGGLRGRGAFIWDVETGRRPISLEPFNAWISDVVFSSDGRYLLSAVGYGWGGRGMLGWWDLTTGRFRRGADGQVITYRDNDGIGDIAISPNRRYVVVANYALRLWDTKNHRERKTFDQDRSEPLLIRRAIFTNDGLKVFGGGLNGVLGMWDIQTGDEVRRFVGHTDDITGLAISSDDKLAVSCGFDGTVRLWDASTGSPVRQFIGHRGIVWAVAITPDGSQAASAGADGTVRFWSLK